MKLHKITDEFVVQYDPQIPTWVGETLTYGALAQARYPTQTAVLLAEAVAACVEEDLHCVEDDLKVELRRNAPTTRGRQPPDEDTRLILTQVKVAMPESAWVAVPVLARKSAGLTFLRDEVARIARFAERSGHHVCLAGQIVVAAAVDEFQDKSTIRAIDTSLLVGYAAIPRRATER